MAKRKNQQGHLPTMEPPKLPAVDAAVKRYIEVRDERMGLSKGEKECKQEVIALLEEQGLTEYENGDIWVKIETGKKKVKARIGGNDPEPEDDDEGDDE